MLDLTSELLEKRIIFLTGSIDDQLAESIVSQLLYLEYKNPYKDISLYINSGGGSINAGMAIVDTMNYIKPNVSAVCIGMAASMASFILSSATKGKRYALPNSTIMIHQPSGGAVGKTDTVVLEAEHLEKTKNKLIAMLAKNANQTFEYMEQQMKVDNFMDANRALDLGLIDKIL